MGKSLSIHLHTHQPLFSPNQPRMIDRSRMREGHVHAISRSHDMHTWAPRHGEWLGSCMLTRAVHAHNATWAPPRAAARSQGHPPSGPRAPSRGGCGVRALCSKEMSCLELGKRGVSASPARHRQERAFLRRPRPFLAPGWPQGPQWAH